MPTPPTFVTGQVLTAAQMNTVAMHLVTTVSFSSTVALSVNNCFTSDYTNYRVLYNITTTNAGGQFLLRLRKNLSDAVTSYSTVGPYFYLSGGTGYSNIVANQNVSFGGAVGGAGGASAAGGGVLEFNQPNVNTYTNVQYFGTANVNNTGNEHYSGNVLHFTAYQADGFTLFSSGSAFSFAGNLQVYGYRK